MPKQDDRFKVRDDNCRIQTKAARFETIVAGSDASAQLGTRIHWEKMEEKALNSFGINRGASQKKRVYRWLLLCTKRSGKDFTQKKTTGFFHRQNRIRRFPQSCLLGFDLEKHSGAMCMGGKRLTFTIFILIWMRVYAPFSIKVMGMVKKVHAGKEVDV